MNFCGCVIDAGQKLLDSLAETWDFFFCDVLSMLQAIFHPVQVHKHLESLMVFSFVGEMNNKLNLSCWQPSQPRGQRLPWLHCGSTQL